ncbi:MAG: shikimate kinase [Thermodesulfobacteriota bacterium]
MGTGKTTLGFHLARALSMTFVDLDGLIEHEAGRSVSEIFSTLGEERFRALEREAVKNVVSGEQDRGIVLATGGGTVVDHDSRALLKQWGLIICLTADIATILERTGKAHRGYRGGGGRGHEKRPLLDTGDREAEIKRLLLEREPAYRDCDMSLDTSVDSTGDLIKKIKAFVDGVQES